MNLPHLKKNMRTITEKNETIKIENGEIVANEIVSKTKTDNGFDASSIAIIIKACGYVLVALIEAVPPIIKLCQKAKEKKEEKGVEKPVKPLLPSVCYGQSANIGGPTPKHGQWLLDGLVTAGELSVIFSSDGQFKSGLFHQILDDIATGAPSSLVPGHKGLESGQKVIILESELTDDDYNERGYTRNSEVVFGANFENIGELESEIDRRVDTLKENTVIGIDDITFAVPAIDPASATRFVNHLKDLIEKKKTEGITLTFLYVCHAEKTLEPHHSIQSSSAFGCSNLVHPCANVIAIGPTRFGDGVKMVKNLKPRHGARQSQVNVLKMVTEGFFHLEHKEFKDEAMVLPHKVRPISVAEDPLVMGDAKEPVQNQLEELANWWASSEKKPTKKEISDRFGVSERTAQNWKNELGLSNKRSKPTKK